MQAHDTYTGQAAAATLEAPVRSTTSADDSPASPHTPAELGSTDALTAGRPGSWEADLVQRLVKGIFGWDDEYLSDFVGFDQAQCFNDRP